MSQTLLIEMSTRVSHANAARGFKGHSFGERTAHNRLTTNSTESFAPSSPPSCTLTLASTPNSHESYPHGSYERAKEQVAEVKEAVRARDGGALALG